ncbi:hypothetical protein CNYM01_13764 [Colletotrichum nymphaeae SA-01]|uniref:Uncharacterized protein n=1 Tax=Colletotrichum nymphaeae SA-01 TaxID=1460502 RepID=A0A135RQY7_9PEZI|nr:hypothetical protein CNYM01_13764 [Colletotrichum nymphaeae SA-01]
MPPSTVPLSDAIIVNKNKNSSQSCFFTQSEHRLPRPPRRKYQRPQLRIRLILLIHQQRLKQPHNQLPRPRIPRRQLLQIPHHHGPLLPGQRPPPLPLHRLGNLAPQPPARRRRRRRRLLVGKRNQVPPPHDQHPVHEIHLVDPLGHAHQPAVRIVVDLDRRKPDRQAPRRPGLGQPLVKPVQDAQPAQRRRHSHDDDLDAVPPRPERARQLAEIIRVPARALEKHVEPAPHGLGDGHGQPPPGVGARGGAREGGLRRVLRRDERGVGRVVRLVEVGDEVGGRVDAGHGVEHGGRQAGFAGAGLADYQHGQGPGPAGVRGESRGEVGGEDLAGEDLPCLCVWEDVAG